MSSHVFVPHIFSNRPMCLDGYPKVLSRLVARRRAVRRPEAGRVAVHGALWGVATVVAARQWGPGSHLHLGTKGGEQK